MIEKLVNQLVSEFNFAKYEWIKENKRILIHFNSQLKIQIEENKEAVVFFSPIGILPDRNQDESLTYLMKANFLGQGTGGACLGMESDEKTLTLSSILSYEINYKTFKEKIEDFCNYVDYWTKEIDQLAEK